MVENLKAILAIWEVKIIKFSPTLVDKRNLRDDWELSYNGLVVPRIFSVYEGGTSLKGGIWQKGGTKPVVLEKGGLSEKGGLPL